METIRLNTSVMMSLMVVVCLVSPVRAAFEVGDLSGTWSIHGAVTGTDPNVAGSFYMTGTADSGGSATAANYVDSQGVGETTWANNSVAFGLSGGGIVSIDVDDVQFHGAMNWDEDLVVSVGTLVPGPDTGLAGFSLWMWVKQSSTPVFTLADCTGTWWLHGLYCSNSWGSWSRGQLQVSGGGAFSFVPGTFLTGDGDANTPSDGSVSLTNYGVFGLSFDPSVHGIMNLGKDVIVFSMPDGEGGNLNVLQKRSGTAFSTADLVGTWNLHEVFASGDTDWTGWSYGVLEVDTAGDVTASVMNNYGSETASDTLAITSDGIVTVASDPNSHGTMSDDKNLVVMTMDNGHGGGELLILTQAIVSPVYRFWSPQNSRHFYTVSTVEKNYVQATFASNIWTYETEAYYAFPKSGQTGLAPVYRFWSNLLGAHFYTISEAERDYVIDNLPAWTYEGPVFYAYPEGSQPVEASPVYRFWSDTLSTHFYTISEAEKDYVINNLPAWEYETIAWYSYD